MSVSIAPGTSVCAVVRTVPSPTTDCMGASRVELRGVACVWGVMVVVSPVTLMAFNSC